MTSSFRIYNVKHQYAFQNITKSHDSRSGWLKREGSCEILSALLNEKSFWHYKGANHRNGPFSHHESNTDIKGGPSTI